MQFYKNDVDYYSLFEADTFDIEERDESEFRGYVVIDGEKILAGTFAYNADGESGYGWYNTSVI